jgi:hypothetical protein
LREHYDAFAIALCKAARSVRSWSISLQSIDLTPANFTSRWSLACVQGSVGTPGSLNFDLCDDLSGGSGGKELRDKAEDIWMPSSATLKEDSDCAVQ